MEVKGLDRSWITERGGNLARLLGEVRRQALAHPQHLQEITAIVRPQLIRVDLDARYQVLGVRRQDYFAEALLAIRCRHLQANLLAHGGTHNSPRTVERAGSGSTFALVRVSATRLAARSSDSKVPASVHHPSRWSKVMEPSRMYALLTSVISNSPR